MISVIIPIRNRAALFKAGLRSWIEQKDSRDEFELVIIDQGSTDGLREMVEEARTKVNLKYFNLDPHSGFVKPMFKRWTNPAFPQNFAAKQCSGDILLFTSPEVVQASTNIIRICESMPMVPAFMYGRVINAPTQALHIGFSYEALSTIKGQVYCGQERPPAREPLVYFLGAMRKEHFMALGGIEELFMRGVAFEDTEFGRRVVAAGYQTILNETVLGIHQMHGCATRDGQEDRTAGWRANESLFRSLPANRVMANEGRPWGVIV